MNDHLNVEKKSNQVLSKGFVVANDADHKRAYLLTHQINRFNTSNVVVLNHNAQEFPDLYSSQKLIQFDRVLCDVPCSSDAAIRKLPQKWATWSPKESQSLHPLQIQILKRGFELLKVGGKISYSTCSLNPIENEAVVAAILKLYGNKIKILDVELPGFKFEKGLTSWKFLQMKSREECDEIDQNGGSYFELYENFTDVPEDDRWKSGNHKHVRETMFPNFYDQNILAELSKCKRVMPHHQDTSGFFITVFEKLAEFDNIKLVDPNPITEDRPLPLQI